MRRRPLRHMFKSLLYQIPFLQLPVIYARTPEECYAIDNGRGPRVIDRARYDLITRGMEVAYEIRIPKIDDDNAQ